MNIKITPQTFMNQAGEIQRSYGISVNGYPIITVSTPAEVENIVKQLKRGDKVNVN